MKYAAIGSLIALTSSVAVLMVVDDQNDRELIEAVAQERVQDVTAAKALEIARCAQSAESRHIVRQAFDGLGSQFPDSAVKDRFLAWLEQCIPERDCTASLVEIPIPETCADGPSALPLGENPP